MSTHHLVLGAFRGLTALGSAAGSAAGGATGAEAFRDRLGLAGLTVDSDDTVKTLAEGSS